MTNVVIAQPIEVAIRDTQERVNISLRDAPEGMGGDPVTATQVKLLVTSNTGSTISYTDAFPELTLTGTTSVAAGSTIFTGTGTRFLSELVEGDSITINAEPLTIDKISSNTRFTTTAVHVAGATDDTITKVTRIVNPGLGEYYIDWGDLNAPANATNNTQTSTVKTWNFIWQVDFAASEQQTEPQVVEVISPHTATLMTYFRNMIDKARMMVSEDPDNPCFLGYTQGQLHQFLMQGLTIINQYQPYPTWCQLDAFPSGTFLHILLEAALLAGVMSQSLFAIATDVPNFSDQGNSFVIQHAPQLAAFLNTISQRLDAQIPKMKWHFVRSGALHIQQGPNFRLTQIMNAAPQGALFRNVYFGST